MIDSMADLFASSITFIAVRISSQPADLRHRYGHGKAEALSALVQAAFITGSGCFISQPLPQADFGLLVMVISLILTIILISFQKYVAVRTASKAINADAAHYSVDVITNLSIIITLLVVKFFGLEWFDTITAIAISSYLLYSSYKLAYDAVALLMDKELDDSIRDNIAKIALSCDHICGLHDMRTHDLGSHYMIELHLELDGNLSLSAAHQYTDNVETELQKAYPGAQIIIHQDPSGLFENRLDDSLTQPR